VCLSGTRARLVAYVEQVHISPNRTAAHTLGDTADRASGTQAAIIRTPPVRSKCTYGNAFVKLPAQSACAQVLAFFNTQHTKCSKQQMQFAFAIPCLDQRVCWSAQVLTLPWPIPQLASVFRAEMRDDLGGAIVLVAGPDESTPLPAAAASLRQLQLKHAVVHLSPLPSSPRNGAPRTAIDATATVDVSSLSRNGGRPPQWLINLALWATLPWVWPQTLAVLRMIPDKSFPLGVRMHKDETGIYRKIRKHTRQQRAARAS